MTASGYPRFQFSLRWLLIAVTLVALLLGLGAFVGPAIAGMLWLLVVVVLPAPLVIVALFGRGIAQAFAIGALIPAVWLMAGAQTGYSLVDLLFYVAASGVSGGIAMATRVWLDPAVRGK